MDNLPERVGFRPPSLHETSCSGLLCRLIHCQCGRNSSFSFCRSDRISLCLDFVLWSFRSDVIYVRSRAYYFVRFKRPIVLLTYRPIRQNAVLDLCVANTRACASRTFTKCEIPSNRKLCTASIINNEPLTMLRNKR